MRWEVLIMASATFNGFMTPYFIAFEPKFEFTQGWDQLNMLIDLVFIVDIFIKMRTTFINEVISQEIVDPREIMVRYLKKQVFIDILAAIPVDYFAYCTHGETAEVLMYLGALRLFRLLKMADIASVVNLPDFLKNFVRLINLIFALTLYCHLSA